MNSVLYHFDFSQQELLVDGCVDVFPIDRDWPHICVGDDRAAAIPEGQDFVFTYCEDGWYNLYIRKKKLGDVEVVRCGVTAITAWHLVVPIMPEQIVFLMGGRD